MAKSSGQDPQNTTPTSLPKRKPASITQSYVKTSIDQRFPRLAEEGIEYLHFVGLGDPKTGREAARAGKYDQFRKIYNSHLATQEAKAALKELTQTVKESVTCLLCFERDPKVCHRSIVSKKLASDEIEILDLYGDSPTRYVDFKTKLARYNPRESAAAA